MPKPNKDSAMLLDVQYIKANKKNNTPDYLYVIWKDLDTGDKYLNCIEEPKMEIYFEKDELRTHAHNKNYERIENLEKRVVKYRDIPFVIANDSPVGRQFLTKIIETKSYSDLQRLFLYPYVFGADYDVASWYRIQWVRTLDNERTKKLRKGFMDIEVDGIEVRGMPSPSDCPINAITLIDDSENQCYTFLLVNREFVPKDTKHMTEKQINIENTRKEMYDTMHKSQEYFRNNQDEIVDELHSLFDESYGELHYNFYYYEDERKMLVHFFQLINILKLDFIGIWNISFDIPYILDRLEHLGLDPAEVICHPDFPVKQCYFKHDIRNHDIKNKSDTFYVSSYTVFYDQMELYASIRKGASELRSYRLNFIAERELKDSKLDYSDDGDIKTLPYLNFKKFAIYNIKDVLLQMGIERRTNDFDTLYVSSYQNATAFDKVFKQTVKLRNVQYLSFLSQGLIPGNNINIFEPEKNIIEENDEDDDDESEYEGALVADPLYNGYEGQLLYGQRTNNIFLNAVDFDMSAFYPSSIMGMNIDPSTLIFKTIMNADQYDICGGKLKFRGITSCGFDPTSDMSKECMDNFQTKNYMTTGTKWFNMPNVYEVYERMKKELG